MHARNLALGDRDQSRRELGQAGLARHLSDSQLLDAVRDAQRRADVHSLRVLCEEVSRRCEDD